MQQQSSTCACGCGLPPRPNRPYKTGHSPNALPPLAITCQQCNSVFLDPLRSKARRYCSIACAYASPTRSPKGVKDFRGEKNPNFRGGGATVICEGCGKEFRRSRPSHTERFCSVACSGKRSEWWSNGHPRGMAGKKHSEETLRLLVERSQHRSPTPEEKLRTRETKLARYGTAGPVNVANPYSRARRGRRVDLDNQYFRSKWEANYARYLNWLCRQKRIKDWKYEARTFRFEGVTRGPYTYLPDFEVHTLDGGIVYHEIKGWMDSGSRSRLARMAQFFPEVNLEIVGEAQYKQLNAMGKVFSPLWE